MKKVYIVIVVTLQLLLLNACGGGGGSEPTTSKGTNVVEVNSSALPTQVEPENTQPKDTSPVLEEEDKNIAVASCNSYTTLEDRDLLVKESDNTIVKVIHSSNNTKEVCVVKGKAYIERV